MPKNKTESNYSSVRHSAYFIIRNFRKQPNVRIGAKKGSHSRDTVVVCADSKDMRNSGLTS